MRAWDPSYVVSGFSRTVSSVPVTPMTQKADAVAWADDTSALQPHLQAQLADYFGRPRSIQNVGRRLCPYTSSFRLDELNVRFTDGSRVHLVLKDLGRHGMLDEARRARPEFLYEPQREINAYRWILPHAPAGTPAWYGAVTDPLADRYWLLLEQVNGTLLWQVGDVSIWEQTATWIARFHRAFSRLQAQQLGKRVGVLVYDEGVYWRWMDRAQRFAKGDREKRRIVDAVARRYGRVVDRLMKLPQTLIHGEFYAGNVIVQKHPRARVCPIDWEMAALAPGLIDLAALTAGWAAPIQRALARAYFAAASDGNVLGYRNPVRLPRQFAADLDCCRLHLAVRMLGWSNDWEPPADHARNWLAEAARISRRLQV